MATHEQQCAIIIIVKLLTYLMLLYNYILLYCTCMMSLLSMLSYIFEKSFLLEIVVEVYHIIQ